MEILMRIDHINIAASSTRREFLAYCGVTAPLIAAAAASWAAQAATRDTDQMAKAMHALADTLEGDLLLPYDERFEPTRSVSWNQMLPDRRPDLIAMAESQADVVSTVLFARDHSLRIAVRCGGHSWCASAVRQDGILLDLSRMKSIAIDPVGATATIEPNVQGVELIHRAALQGLAFPVAHCPSVPLSGFLLSGGNGWNFNRWGRACTNVTAVDLVLADGRELTASNEQNSDLFWAARGAGPGFFAVVTRYHLKLHSLPRAITFSSYVFPGSAKDTPYELMDSISGKLSPDVELLMSIGAPPPDLAGDNDTISIITAIAFTDSAADAEDALKPLNGDPRVRDAISSSVNAPGDFTALFGMMSESLPGGQRYLVDNIWSDTPLKTMLVGSREHYADAPSGRSHILAIAFHPEFELKGTAHSLSKKYLVYNVTLWTDAADDVANTAWHSGATELLEPHKAGRYIAEADLGKEANVARQCYTPPAWERLRALRATYDPGGLFHDYLGSA
jgi:FAD/FMN-containing dehydrogenase